MIKKVLIGLHIAKDFAEAIAAEATINLLLQYSVSVPSVLTVGIICIVALRIVIRRINEYKATIPVSEPYNGKKEDNISACKVSYIFDDPDTE